SIGLFDGRTRNDSSPRTAMHRTDGVVVGIEKISIFGGTLVAAVRMRGLNDKIIKEPTGMRQMPLGRAGVWHGLDDVILDFERLTQLFREGSHLAITLEPVPAVALDLRGQRGLNRGRLFDATH